MSVALQAAYLIASVLFILALRGLSSPESARRGILLGEIGMLIAVVGTLFHKDIVSYTWIAVAMAIGSVIGASISVWIPMTKMPERIAFSHAFGGLAAALVGVTEYYTAIVAGHALGALKMGALGFECLLGSLTFTGSLMAFGKLQGVLPGAPITYRLQNATNAGLFLAAAGMAGYLVLLPDNATVFYVMLAAGFASGVLLVLPIGGADMPVVISLLNSYAGLAACATGFALGNNILIIAGALDGASGFLLSIMMSRAMNRSFSNVLFGAFGAGEAPSPTPGAPHVDGATYHEGTIYEAAEVLRAAQSVIVVPGYGMAVSQAQHAVRDLMNLMISKHSTVKYAIHPVAGRMPGHMNVLLAEANVPYDQLFDLDDINDDFARTDVVLVVGANDVVNPAAKTNPGSPIFGMPVFNVDRARMAIVLKRSMNPGFSGIENELFVSPNTMMVLGDAKKTLASLTAALKD
jgi:H+-translocating NAD(P) transhydrogenase subunit beta